MEGMMKKLLGGGRQPLGFRMDQLNPAAIRRNGGILCFVLFVLAVLIFTLITATYQHDDPLLRASSSKITSFLTSTSNATFLSDPSVLCTGEDLVNPSSGNASTQAEVLVDQAPSIQLSEITTTAAGEAATTTEGGVAKVEDAPACDPTVPVDCKDSDLFYLLMRTAIEFFPNIRFYRFGKPVPGSADSCDMAWRFRPKEATRRTIYKDYRRFHLTRLANCTILVSKIDEYHSGVNARKHRRSKKGSGGVVSESEAVFEPKGPVEEKVAENLESVLAVGEAVDDTLPVIESESAFRSGRYLIYVDGCDRCKSMDQYMWSFLCALGEAQYLNRTFVMDLNICLNKMYTGTEQDVDGKNFRFYFDFEHLKDSALVIDQNQFWADWTKWEEKDKMTVRLINDFRVTPMSLAGVKDTLIMRKFGEVEPDNYWYRVCEAETAAVIRRPWHMLWKSRRLLEIVSAMSARLNWDFDSVHIVRGGDKAKNSEMSPDALLAILRDKIEDGCRLYIATDHPDTSFFNPLKDKYSTYFLDDFKDLWNETSEWYTETKELNNGVPVEFDGYMRIGVDTEMFLRGKKQLETLNDLTGDCQDGVNSCIASSSSIWR